MDTLNLIALKKAESGGGGGGDITVESLSVSANGTYTATTGKAYSPVTVAVPQTTVSSLSVSENGTYTATAGTAYSPVSVSVPQTTVSALSVTENGTYTATEGTAYSPVTVNVPAGGGPGYTKVYTTEVTANTTSTSGTVIANLSTGASFDTPSKYILVCIYDKAGPRDGYFYGEMATLPMRSSWTNATSIIHFGVMTTDSGELSYSSTNYGVYASRIYKNGNIDISTRYSSSFSLTINGTYKIDVYTVDYPTGFSPAS